MGSPEKVRDDLTFLLDVVKDAERRWPIDMERVVAGGFSQGASMVWDLACYRARYFTAFIPFSGGYWPPMPPSCNSGPVALRHTHRLHEHMVPLVGRAILDGKYKQADILEGLTRWRAEDRCGMKPDKVADEGDLTCNYLTQCEAVGEVALCLHNGDHAMIATWLEANLKWALTARSVPALAP